MKINILSLRKGGGSIVLPSGNHSEGEKLIHKWIGRKAFKDRHPVFNAVDMLIGIVYAGFPVFHYLNPNVFQAPVAMWTLILSSFFAARIIEAVQEENNLQRNVFAGFFALVLVGALCFWIIGL
ncbi:hypothetical protein HCN83_07745 [Bacillus luteus]|uniref:Uncharacterized protein n=1 Tax=Alkalicoccus luteus TaxID=1237094 RepID=A0A969TTB5_9BACI|nr:hypothetical protein [Alkalicoccus luteus]